MTHQTIRSFRDLQTWQRAMELAEACYRIAADLPSDERYGLAMQILNHLAIALGSQAELETELELAERLLHADINDAKALVIEVGKLLHGLVWTLKRSANPERPSFLVAIPSH